MWTSADRNSNRIFGCNSSFRDLVKNNHQVIVERNFRRRKMMSFVHLDVPDLVVNDLTCRVKRSRHFGR